MRQVSRTDDQRYLTTDQVDLKLCCQHCDCSSVGDGSEVNELHSSIAGAVGASRGLSWNLPTRHASAIAVCCVAVVHLGE